MGILKKKDPAKTDPTTTAQPQAVATQTSTAAVDTSAEKEVTPSVETSQEPEKVLNWSDWEPFMDLTEENQEILKLSAFDESYLQITKESVPQWAALLGLKEPYFKVLEETTPVQTNEEPAPDTVAVEEAARIIAEKLVNTPEATDTTAPINKNTQTSPKKEMGNGNASNGKNDKKNKHYGKGNNAVMIVGILTILDTIEHEQGGITRPTKIQVASVSNGEKLGGRHYVSPYTIDGNALDVKGWEVGDVVFLVYKDGTYYIDRHEKPENRELPVNGQFFSTFGQFAQYILNNANITGNVATEKVTQVVETELKKYLVSVVRTENGVGIVATFKGNVEIDVNGVLVAQELRRKELAAARSNK